MKGKTGNYRSTYGGPTKSYVPGAQSGNHSNPKVMKIAEGTENRNSYAAGGRCGMAEGGSSRPRLDRPGRKMGGAAPNTPVKEWMKKDGGACMKDGGFLSGLKKGALHKELGVSKGEKIPAKKLEKAAHSDNPLLKKRAVFAENAKKWNHK